MRGGSRPAHLIPWAPADYLTSRTRMRAVATQDHLLRLVYREVLDVLYAEGGAVSRHALPDLTALPADEVDRCLDLCVGLGSLAVDGDVVTNPRVTRTLAELAEVRGRRAAGGRAGAGFGYLGPIQRESGKHPLKGIDVSPSGIGIGIHLSSEKEGKGKGRPTWLTPFGDAWTAALDGIPPWGPLAKELKPVVDRLGEDATLAGWRRYLAETEGRFVSPSAFAKKVGLWVRKPKTAPPPKPKLAAPDAKVYARWAQARERIEMPPHLKRTWLSPVGGQSLSDQGTLLLVAPSKEHAAAVLRYKDKIMAAYNDAEFYDDAPALQVATVVVAPDAELHDGAL